MSFTTRNGSVLLKVLKIVEGTSDDEDNNLTPISEENSKIRPEHKTKYRRLIVKMEGLANSLKERCMKMTMIMNDDDDPEL
jgi:hypothetical protein